MKNVSGDVIAVTTKYKEKLTSKKVLEFSKGRQKKKFCQVTHNLNLSCHLGDKVLGLTLVALMILACMGLVEA